MKDNRRTVRISDKVWKEAMIEKEKSGWNWDRFTKELITLWKAKN